MTSSKTEQYLFSVIIKNIHWQYDEIITTQLIISFYFTA